MHDSFGIEQPHITPKPEIRSKDAFATEELDEELSAAEIKALLSKLGGAHEDLQDGTETQI